MSGSIGLYDKNDIKAMQSIEKIGSQKKNRLQHIIDYCKEMGYNKIGIVNCIALEIESKKLFEDLKEAGFDVFKVHCREGGLNKSDYDEDGHGSSCNPAYQSKFMKDNNVDFVIIMGLCVGHDAIFSKYCDVPSTTLVVKDFLNENNTTKIFR